MGETVEVMRNRQHPRHPQAPPSPAKAPKPGGMVGIWIGIVLILVGIIGGIALIASGARPSPTASNGSSGSPIASGGTVDLDETGTYSVFVERYGPTRHQLQHVQQRRLVPDVQVAIIDPDGNPAPVRPRDRLRDVHRRRATRAPASASSTPPSRASTRSASIGGRRSPTTTRIAVGTGLHLDGIVAILVGVFGGGALVLLGIILVIVFAVKRSRQEQAARQAATRTGPACRCAPGGWPAAPAYGGYPPTPGTAPGCPWQPPAGAPGWVPPPAPRGSGGGLAHAAAGAARPARQPRRRRHRRRPRRAAAPGAPTWAPPPPPAPAQEPPRREPPAPPAGTDEPEP